MAELYLYEVGGWVVDVRPELLGLHRHRARARLHRGEHDERPPVVLHGPEFAENAQAEAAALDLAVQWIAEQPEDG